MGFISVLDQIGRDFKKGLDVILPYAVPAGEIAISVFAPALGPLFNTSVSAIALVEQKYTALGKQSGTGDAKLAEVLALLQPFLAQGLAAAGKANDTTAVTAYINAIVAVLNAIAAPVAA